ncbi:hypothetical protein M3231_08085 [Neobacillus mesonae]|nr:hypothetical protein [Neobacillus mesonae]
MQPWSTIVILGLCVIVYAWFIPKSKAHSGQNVIEDVESTLDQYLAEIELENDKVIQKLKEYQQEWLLKDKQREQEIGELNQQVKSLELRLSVQAEQIISYPADKQTASEFIAATEEEKAGAQEEIPMKDNSTIQLRFPELFQLYSEGKSVDFIAKKLNIPKGEVQVIVQLGEREESR